MSDDPQYIDLITGKPLEPWAAEAMKRKPATPGTTSARGEELDGSGLRACPHCGQFLFVRDSVNAYGRCETEGCWTHERKLTVPLDDPRQVEQWNTRTALANPPAMQVPGRDLERAAKVCADRATDLSLKADALIKAGGATLPHLPDGKIYGWVTHGGHVYSGEGYPVPPRKFILDKQSCAAILIAAPLPQPAPTTEGEADHAR